MASISFPVQHQTTTLPHYFDSSDSAPNGLSRRNQSMSAPLPNPPFVFPARQVDDSHDRESDSMTHDRQPLPAFSFKPGSTDSEQISIPAPPMNRVGGHRRQYSEFVGSDRLVTPGNTAAPHTNDDGLTTSAKLPPPGPGFSAANRRRHAHRRSAAISSVDLTAISNTVDTKPYAESAPCTPANSKRETAVPGEPSKTESYSATSLSRPTPPPASPRILIDGKALDSEYLTERPLNQCHSTERSLDVSEPNNLVFSGISARKSDNTISFSKDESPPEPQKSRPRPKTADASLMFEQSGVDLTDHSPSKRPRSAAGHSRHKSMSAGIVNATSRKSHVEDDNITPSPFRHSSDDDSDVATDDIREPSNSPVSAAKKRSKAKKRQKKVRSWAGSLLIKGKGKRQNSKKNTSQGDSGGPPPALTRTNSDLGSGLDVEFDEDNIVVIRTPTNPTYPETQQAPGEAEAESWASLENSWKPRSFYEQTTTIDSMSPVIDLDAALGPFNTPEMRSGASESGFSAATKRMYSGGRRGEFIGPEMRYHRRAESAPEMPPFDRTFLGSHRFTTSSSLENPDVFYEEEEDAFLAATSDSAKESEEHLQTQAALTGSNDDGSDHSGESSDTLMRQPRDEPANEEHSGLGIQKPESDEAKSSTIALAMSEDASKHTEPRSYSSRSQKTSTTGTGRPKSPMQYVKNESWNCRNPVPPSPEVSPRFLPVDYRPVTSPTELPSTIPPFSLHGGCSLPNSSFPSPDFTISSDARRSITTSSTTDPFPHGSVEDVPSLTSSASTMTNTLNRMSATFFARPRLSTDRSASFSAAVHRRSSQPSSKRSSLASLSKLVVGPHNEKSKLSHEEKPPSDEPEKAKKKGRRISRLMHFWRIKDKEKPSEHDVQE
ncbi:putative cell wall proline rich protein [Aspergillus lucknowensis]|uniref:Cell wall proline rich protein n=1 Tax=Aspergillus lucknowensis TaxID=176173 RepID=A0ABR4LXN9_9EURO